MKSGTLISSTLPINPRSVGSTKIASGTGGIAPLTFLHKFRESRAIVAEDRRNSGFLVPFSPGISINPIEERFANST